MFIFFANVNLYRLSFVTGFKNSYIINTTFFIFVFLNELWHWAILLLPLWKSYSAIYPKCLPFDSPLHETKGVVQCLSEKQNKKNLLSVHNCHGSRFNVHTNLSKSPHFLTIFWKLCFSFKIILLHYTIF